VSARLVFTHDAWEDYLHWQRTDKATLSRLNRLLLDVLRDPFSGLGKPEPLRNDLTGYWSRRIDEEHRLVYGLEGEDIVVVQARFHYGK
jgi:toxin YoeB